MLRIDTMSRESQILILNSGQSQVSNIPAILLLFNHADSGLVINEGDVGIAVYSNETSLLGDISGTGGTLLLHSVTAASVDAQGLVVTEQNVLIAGQSSL